MYQLKNRHVAPASEETSSSPVQQNGEQLAPNSGLNVMDAAKTDPLPGSTPSPSSLPYSPKTQALLNTLTDILRSRNDNDPRLDRDFRNLTSEDKAALRTKYEQLPAEDRNGKGTIVFLVGREIKEASDLNFIKGVMAEPPCMSLADCKKDTRPANGADTHQDTSIEITLAYPQMVSLYSLESFLSAPDTSPTMREEALKMVQEAKNSPIAPIRRKAQDIESRLKKS
jgi:hypothetical protein